MTENVKDRKYHARAWRTKVLTAEAARDGARMLEAFVPEGFGIDIDAYEECDPSSEVPGFPHAARYKFHAILRDKRPEKPSDAHFFVQAYTRDGCVAKLLAHILDGCGFFPLT